MSRRIPRQRVTDDCWQTVVLNLATEIFRKAGVPENVIEQLIERRRRLG